MEEPGLIRPSLVSARDRRLYLRGSVEEPSVVLVPKFFFFWRMREWRDTAASSSKGPRGEREEQCRGARGREGNVLNKLVYFTTVQTCFISFYLSVCICVRQRHLCHAERHALPVPLPVRYCASIANLDLDASRVGVFLRVALRNDGQGIYLGLFSLPVPVA